MPVLSARRYDLIQRHLITEYCEGTRLPTDGGRPRRNQAIIGIAGSCAYRLQLNGLYGIPFQSQSGLPIVRRQSGLPIVRRHITKTLQWTANYDWHNNGNCVLT